MLLAGGITAGCVAEVHILTLQDLTRNEDQPSAATAAKSARSGVRLAHLMRDLKTNPRVAG